MSQKSREILISDADVLIDYAGADIGILEIMAGKLWQLHATLPTLREVRALPIAKAEKMGILICEPTLAELDEASRHSAALSGPDRLCFVIARTRGWSCLTNDRLLRRNCDAAGVHTIWGLEAMLHLKRACHITRARAAKTAEAIHELNPQHITADILQRFLGELGP